MIHRAATPPDRVRTSTVAAAAIILLYTLLSLYRLGAVYAPETCWTSGGKGDQICLDLGGEREIGSLSFYLGVYENRRLRAEVGSGSPIRWQELPQITMGRVFQWGRADIRAKGQYIRLTTLDQSTEIRELIVTDSQGQAVCPVNRAEYPTLFDEDWMYPGYSSYQSGTVFDESFFARTAYEYLHGLRSYEDTHPPLGKLMLVPGIACFGMTPFGWRIGSLVAGTLLLILLWAFCCRLFDDPWISVGVLALMALDLMHFTQSRLGQVDAFLVLFMTGMSYFMFRYQEVMAEGDGKKSWRYLWASGIAFGLAISCKWSGFYGGLGLALVWASIQIRQIRKGRIGWKELGRTCMVCCASFVAVPLLLYLLSYIPYVAMDKELGFWERVAKNQINMFRYHSQLDGSHASASRWFQWPMLIRPVRLFRRWAGNGDLETLALMGNPAFWWPGLAMLLGSLWRLTERPEGGRRLAFLLTSYLAPLLPWIFIGRYSFLYHYYPSLPFLALIMGWWASDKGKWGRRCLWVCVAASAVLGVLFYPVIAGLPVPGEYVARWLEWLPTWDFTS